MNLESIFKTLGWPLTLVAVVASVFALFGLPYEQALLAVGALTFLPLLIALVINVGKTLGIVDDGTSGKWSAAINLAAFVGIAFLFKLYPTFDLSGLDVRLTDILKAVTVLVGYVLELVASKKAHGLYVNTLGVKAFSFSAR